MGKSFETLCLDRPKFKASLNALSISPAVSGYPDNDYHIIYGRYGNYTCQQLEHKYLALYNKEYIEQDKFHDVKGYKVRFLSSGMQALNSLFFLLAVDGKNKVVIADDAYYELIKLSKSYKFWDTSVIDIDDEKKLVDSITPDTRMVSLASMNIPFYKRHNIKRICDIVHGINSRVMVVVDNTLLSPYYYNPFEDGADIVVDSLTKYINGFGDVTGGAIVLPRIVDEGIPFNSINLIGGQLDAFSAYLVNRGINTLPVRMDRITSNARKIYSWLQSKKVIDCYYGGVGGVISLTFGSYRVNEIFVDSFNLFEKGATFGLDHSMITLSADYENYMRSISSIDKWSNFVRLSIGLENVDDLIAELESVWAKFYYLQPWQYDTNGKIVGYDAL